MRFARALALSAAVLPTLGLCASLGLVVGCGDGVIDAPGADPAGEGPRPVDASSADTAVDSSGADVTIAPDAPVEPPPSDTGSPADTTVTTPPDTGTPTPVDGAIAGCSVVLTGAAGAEPSGTIPVCCTPEAADKTEIMAAFALVNEHRAANGKPALTYDDELALSIQGHCEHMSLHPFFAHAAPEPAVASFTTRASKCGGSAGGENIAWGYHSGSAVIAGWKASPGHNANMLGDWGRIGMGKSGTYWGQVFGY